MGRRVAHGCLGRVPKIFANCTLLARLLGIFREGCNARLLGIFRELHISSQKFLRHSRFV